MSLVEKEITKLNVELARQSPELEKYNETEHKLTPSNPEVLEQLFGAQAYPVEQLYLSNPEDEFSLRVRRSEKPEGIEYSAAQKERAQERPGDALTRREIPTPISAETFAYYKSMDLPTVTKRRADVMEGVTVDFIDDPVEPVIVEIEHNDPAIRAYLLTVMQDMAGGTLVDRSHDPALTNEAIAHRLYSKERSKNPESLDVFVRRVTAEMVAQYVTGKNTVVTTLRGMSGSGKSTVVKMVQEQITELFGESFRPLALSTDDYHFGKQYLEEHYGAPYVDWDHGNTYNTLELSEDLQALRGGKAIQKRFFDFATEEPVRSGEHQPSPFVIVEGLYAGSSDLYGVRDLHFDLPTSIADCIGRDTRRIVIENRANHAFPTPESRLRYQLEVALPLYQEQHSPERARFSACARPLGERAWMLASL